MLTWAAILFAAAALGGVVMVVMRSRDRMPPLGLGLLHGLLAAGALVLLALVVLGGDVIGPLLTASLALFVLAALGGFLLLASHLLRKGTFSLGVALAHGGTAVVAFVLLLAGIPS
jgi:hypothetical protein